MERIGGMWERKERSNRGNEFRKSGNGDMIRYKFKEDF